MLPPFLATVALAALAQDAAPAALKPFDPVAGDWQPIPDDDVLVFTLRNGRKFVLRLAPAYAPRHVANIRALARAHWWDGTSVYRVQDNYVAQWGDASEKKPLPAGVIANPPPEFEHARKTAVTRLSRPDPYALWAGHSADGWPVAGNDQTEWLTHCYGMVGVGRDLAPSTGSGAELYAVIGLGPRALDRNIALVGRVIEGIDALSTLPRGTKELGFYATEPEFAPIVSARLASDLPAAERPHYQYRATDNPRFTAWIGTRENRQPPFFAVPAGGADICYVMPEIRKAP